MIEKIRNCPLHQLQDAHYLEHDLLPSLGFNDALLNEQPKIVQENTGGLFSWQYPNQFSKLLVKLSKQKIHSYLEIGVHRGGTFIILSEYLKRFNDPFHSCGVDVEEFLPVKKYCEETGAHFHCMNSQSQAFATLASSRKEGWDLVLIDGDHSLEGCFRDLNLVRPLAKNLIFHDICSLVCPGVCAVWMHLKAVYGEKYHFFEYLDQYPDVLKREGLSYLGLGLALENFK